MKTYEITYEITYGKPMKTHILGMKVHNYWYQLFCVNAKQVPGVDPLPVGFKLLVYFYFQLRNCYRLPKNVCFIQIPNLE